MCCGRWGFKFFSWHSKAQFGTESPSRRCFFSSHEWMPWVSKSTRDPHSRAVILWLQPWSTYRALIFGATAMTSKPANPTKTLDSQAHAQDTHQRHHSTPRPKWTSTRSRHKSVSSPVKKVDSTSTRLKHKWHHNISKPVILPHVDARFHKHLFETHIRDQNTSKQAIPRVGAQFHKHPLQAHVNGIKTHQKQLFPGMRSMPFPE